MIKEYLQYLADNKMYSSNTIRRYHAVLVDFAHVMCGRSWSTITRTDIEKYIASKSSASESTKASVLSAVRDVFRFACTHYGLPVNPARYISAPKLQKRIPHVVAAEDIAAAMKAAPKRIQLAIMLMHLCGLRVSECLSLTIEDFKEHRIIVRGKGKKERYVYVVSIIEELAHELCSSGLLFPDTSDRQFRYDIYCAFRAVGVEMSPHMLRHTFASNMANAGIPLSHLAQLLGHESIKTTQIYLHADNQQVRNSYYKYV